MAGGLSTPEAEYAKDPKIKKEDISTLMEWASKQPHLPQLIGNFIIVLKPFLSRCQGVELQISICITITSQKS